MYISNILKNTLTQLLKNQYRAPKKQRCLVPALLKCPQKLGTVIRVFEQAPKKPNSARRKVARVKIKSSGRHITCHLPGEGHNLTKHATVLIRGGRCQDLIGVRYKPIRGKESFAALDKRVTRLSKFGVKKKPRFIESREAFAQYIKDFLLRLHTQAYDVLQTRLEELLATELQYCFSSKLSIYHKQLKHAHSFIKRKTIFGTPGLQNNLLYVQYFSV